MNDFITHHGAYKIRTSILQRCYNPKNISYPKHGAIGVKVCQQWLDDPQSFIDWADKTGFVKGKVQLARRDNKADFSPENCMWVPRKARSPIKISNGDIFKTKQGYTIKILNYVNKNEIDIVFLETENQQRTTKSTIRDGVIKNPLHPSVFGVGFNYGGPYKSSSKEYRCWMDMMRRCYDKNFIGRNSYVNCEVDEQWHNFQEFAEWCQWQKGFGNEGWQLDKDWLSIKDTSKVYGPENCCFLPRKINCLATKSKDGKEPTGVDAKTSKGKFRVSISQEGGNKNGYVGSYETFEEANQVYKSLKKSVVTKVAEEYKECIDERLYITMLNWEAS